MSKKSKPSYEIHAEDSPVISLIKQALNSKGVTIEDYRHKYENEIEFNNDRHALKKRRNMPLSNMMKMAKNCDIKIIFRAEDLGPDVPNPMENSIRVELLEDVVTNSEE